MKIVLSILLICSVLLSSNPRDTLTLKNGKIHIGEIQNFKELTQGLHWNLEFVSAEAPAKTVYNGGYLPAQQISAEKSIPLTKISSLVYDEKRYPVLYGKIITPDIDTSSTILTIPKEERREGIYRNWADFYFNTPQLAYDSVYIQKKKSSTKRGIYYKIKFYNTKKDHQLNENIDGRIWGYCDGENFFVNQQEFAPLNIDKGIVWSLYDETMHIINSKGTGLDVNKGERVWMYILPAINPSSNMFEEEEIGRTELSTILKKYPKIYGDYKQLHRFAQSDSIFHYFERMINEKRSRYTPKDLTILSNEEIKFNTPTSKTLKQKEQSHSAGTSPYM